jgi:hypothetical protein
MQPHDQEPEQQEVEKVLKEEERTIIQKPDVPDDVKSEIAERLDRLDEADRDQSS